jgi:hypothetical protein
VPSSYVKTEKLYFIQKISAVTNSEQQTKLDHYLASNNQHSVNGDILQTLRRAFSVFSWFKRKATAASFTGVGISFRV